MQVLKKYLAKLQMLCLCEVRENERDTWFLTSNSME